MSPFGGESISELAYRFRSRIRMLNRRHKAILFITLVMTGSGLLAGARLNEALGIFMLGVALFMAMVQMGLNPHSVQRSLLSL